MSGCEEADGANVSFALNYFVEHDAIIKLIENAKHCYEDEHLAESSYEAVKKILNKYIDQPHLIDPYLERILNAILNIMKDENVPYNLKQYLSSYLFIVINIRGYKHIIRFLPHEVSDLDIALSLLEESDKHQNTRWEMHYFLLLWLSIIIMIPFDMSRLEADVKEVGDKTSIPEKILQICKNFISTTYKSQDAASYLYARFVSRIDMKNKYLSHVIDWLCNEVVNESKNLSWQKFGSMIALALILKHGKREDLLPYTDRIFGCLSDANCFHHQYRLTRKYAVKLIQRAGLVCLPVRIASWRYNRGCRSLVLSLNPNAADNSDQPSVDMINSEIPLQAGSDNVPPLVEEVMVHLLEALRDDDITVRWSAAKGIGRITDRLTSEFGDEVVDNILTFFSPREPSCAWNGGCLALAELGRRGLLLPKRLPQVVSVLVKALVYEAPLRGVTAGTFVRDAACYTTWSLARAYDPEILKPYVPKIAACLLIVASFDREVSCRRAASATFQEHVGRQGTFPHGIEILTVTDYFAVGGRRNCYLNISVFVAQFPEYTKQMIDHLFDYKIKHWDIEIRDLASKALHNLTPLDPVYMLSILEKIIPLAKSVDVQTRHGALLSIGEIIHALSKLPNSDVKIGDYIIKSLWELIPMYYKNEQFRGAGGDVNKESCCFLIMKCSLGKFPVQPDVMECWQRLINECLPYESSKVRIAAAQALSAFSEQYYVGNEDKKSTFMKHLQIYFKEVASFNETSRSGYALALGSLPPALLENHLDFVIDYLIKNTVITNETVTWAPARKECIDALVSIWKKFCIDSAENTAEKYLPYTVVILNTFLRCLSDYTVDKRGDIGSVVREASMKGIQVLITSDPSRIKNVVSVELMELLLTGVAKQAVERINKIRQTASDVFSTLLFSDIPEIPHLNEIRTLFEGKKNSSYWQEESVTFALFAKLLKYPAFTRPLLCGFIKSIGGITESLVKCATTSLTTYLDSCSSAELNEFCKHIVDEFRTNLGNDLITKPILSFLQKFLASSNLKIIIDDPQNTFADDVYTLTKREIAGTKDCKKLMLAMEVFCHLIQVGGKIAKNSLSTLSILLCHRFTWLRKMVALNLSEAIMMYSNECGISPENEDEIMELLTGHNWHDCSIEDARKTRNKLCTLLDIPVPTLKTSAETPPQGTN